jgi:hypothetical protein
MGEKREDGRTKLIERARVYWTKRGARWLMSLMVAATAAIGLLASIVMLALGLHVMWLRYMLATAIAYAGFLALVRWWIRLAGADGSPPPTKTPSEVVGEAIDATSQVLDGASFSLDVADGTAWAPDIAIPDLAPVTASGLPDFDLPVDLDLGDDDGVPLMLLLILAAAVAAAVVAAIMLIYTAPLFFAEVFVDAGLGYGLYRRLKSSCTRNWLQTAVARSWLPFLFVALVLGAAGFMMHEFVPEAVSIGGVFARGN